MTDDRSAFTEARDAGLKQRHELRLEHARYAHYNEAVKAASLAIRRAYNGDSLTWRAEAEAALEAALPHLRAHQIELQTRIGHELGRKEAGEEIAEMLYAHADSLSDESSFKIGIQRAADLVARRSRGIGKGEPT